MEAIVKGATVKIRISFTRHVAHSQNLTLVISCQLEQFTGRQKLTEIWVKINTEP